MEPATGLAALADEMSLPVRLDEDGAAAPPRENGELAFGAPWESRLFGLTMALVEGGQLDWEMFRGRLIARIADWEAGHRDETWDYWQRWREAFEDSLESAGLVEQPEIERLVGRLARRPHGHDHPHDHHHDHTRERAANAAGEIDE